MVEAYELNKVGPWAIWCQKNILFTSDGIDNDDVEQGADQLEQVLGKMRKHGSMGTYELVVYKLSEADQEIDTATRRFRGFGFSLYENQYEGESNSDNRMLQLLTKMDERLTLLEAKGQVEQEVIEEEDTSVMGKIGSMAMGILSRPDVQQAIAIGAVNLVKGAVGMVKNMVPNMKTAESDEGRKVAGVHDAVGQNLLSQVQIEKVHLAINRLATRDELLGDHLTKLADIAENEPAKYKMALNFL